METFRMISATACFLGIVITIFNKLYPSEKFEKQLKTIFSLIFLISVITPVMNGNLYLPSINEAVMTSNEYYQEISSNTDEYFIKAVENNISGRFERELNSKNIFPVDIQTSVNISDNNSISISEVTVLMPDSKYIDEVKSCIYANIGKDAAVNVKTKEG